METFSPLDDVLAPVIAREGCLKEPSAWPFPQVRDAWAVQSAGDRRLHIVILRASRRRHDPAMTSRVPCACTVQKGLADLG